jgi:hypothetical protein
MRACHSVPCFFSVPMLLILSLFDLCNAGGVLIIGFILQCYNVLVRHVWEIAFIQKVCEKFYSLSYASQFNLLEVQTYKCFSTYFIFLVCIWRAFVFFSSPISRELVSHIKKDSSVLTRIGALREVRVSFSVKLFVLWINNCAEANLIFQLDMCFLHPSFV